MTGEDLDRLAVPPMVLHDEDAKGTAFTVTVDATDRVSTGISAADRASTIQVLADPSSGPTDDTGGVHLVPASTGLGAPHWDDAARGLIAGLTFGSSRAQVARAATESIAFQVRDVVEVPEPDAVGARGPLHPDGGASRNAALMQFQADLLGREVFVGSSSDLAAMGVAALAGGQLGWWDPREAVARADDATVHGPRMSEDERDGRYAAWLVTVSRAYAGQADDHGPP